MPWPKGKPRSPETIDKMRLAHRGRVCKSIESRFWAKVAKSGVPDGCWLWTGASRRDEKNSYGHFFYKGRIQRSHRVAYELMIGPIPEGFQVLHNCPGGDNPRCVNPNHLFLGTHTDNMKDASRKNRLHGCTGYHHTEEAKKKLSEQRSGVPKPEVVKAKIRASKRAASPLSEAVVIELKKLRAEGWTYVAIGKQFGISSTTAFNVVHGKTWA